MMGRVVLPVLCSHDLDGAAVQNLLTGCAGGGLWCVFENFAALSLTVCIGLQPIRYLKFYKYGY